MCAGEADHGPAVCSGAEEYRFSKEGSCPADKEVAGNANMERYNENMRPLIERDIAEVMKMMEG